MARGLNKVQIIGYLGHDPTVQQLPSGNTVTNITVAVGRSRRDPDGQRYEETEWFRVVLWDKLAETAAEALHKGARVYIDGRLQSRRYADRAGVERTAVEIIAQELLVLGGRPPAEETPPAATTSVPKRRNSRAPGAATRDTPDTGAAGDAGDAPF